MKSLLSVALVLSLSALVSLSPAATTSTQEKGAKGRSVRMADAAQAWIESLSSELDGRAVLAFDDEERKRWNYLGDVPRRGVALGELTGQQRVLFDRLLRQGLSADGYMLTHGVLSLEEVLGADPQNYFVTVFGDPSGSEPWGWRLEGHHLSLNFTSARGSFVTGTPMFFGVQPYEVSEGLKAGFHPFYEKDRVARDLIADFNDKQRRFALRIPGELPDPLPEGVDAATYGTPPDDIFLKPDRAENFERREGLSPRSMDFSQRLLFMRLLNLHVQHLHPDLTTPIMSRYREHDIYDHTFLWIGSDAPGQPFYYRLHSQKKDFAIEVSNRDGDHAHIVWRDFTTDFGGDQLKQHVERANAGDGFNVQDED